MRATTGISLCLVVLCLCAGAWADDDTLSLYVHTPDPAFNYELVQTIEGAGYTVYVLRMDSLHWRSTKEVDRTLWSHQILIVVPAIVTSNSALMIVNGGSDPDDPPDDELLTLGALLATVSGSVLAAVSQIPNQPLLFPDETAAISEDALVAYSWDKAMDTGDAHWAAYLPMTKAAVRGLDAVQEFVNTSVPDTWIDDFVVTGFSKRGATAWLVAAVDERVRAVAPGVFDVLDLPLQIERHYRAYGFYSPAIEDYVNYGIVRRVRSPEGRFLTGIVDPLSYARQLTMPKFLLNATGDQFFLPDAANYYVDRLPGDTLIRQVPNTDHGFTDALLDGLNSLLAWYQTFDGQSERPVVDWQLGTDGALTITSDPPASGASLWQATNADARDFRLETLGAQWTQSELSPIGDGRWRVMVTPPTVGYTGYLVTLRFAGSSPEQTYGTPVFVTPDTLPFRLDDPIAAPRSASYWACQLAAERGDCPAPPDFGADELLALLPFPVFGTYLGTLAQLADALDNADDGAAAARRACTATRLNIQAEKLGWYSQTTQLPRTAYLWEIYAAAEDDAARNQPKRAYRRCTGLNRLR